MKKEEIINELEKLSKTDPIDRCQSCGRGYNDKGNKQEHLCQRCKDQKKAKLPTKQYLFYRDPGHAWLAVTRKELIDLHIDRIISKYSYQKGNLVYLEEDHDANLFLNKAIHQAKFNIELCDYHSDKDSIIRTYKSYSPDTDRELQELKMSLASIKGMSFMSTCRAEIKVKIKKLEAKKEQEKELRAETTYPDKLEEYDPSLHKEKPYPQIEALMSEAYERLEAAQDSINQLRDHSDRPGNWLDLSDQIDTIKGTITELMNLYEHPELMHKDQTK